MNLLYACMSLYILDLYMYMHVQAESKTMAKSNIESVSRHYMNAKRSAQEYENLSRGLNRGGTSIPLRGSPQEIQQVEWSIL